MRVLQYWHQRLYYVRTKNPVTKCYPSGNRTTGLRFQVQPAPFYTNLTFASLYSHALLILIGSSNSKNQVVHEQMFKDLPSSKSPVSVERSMLDLET